MNNPKLIILRHINNQGVGGAMLSGYSKAIQLGSDIIIKVDGDDQMDPDEMCELIKPIVLGEADFCKGNRFIHSKELNYMPFIRRVGNFALTFLTKLVSGYWDIFDPTNGYICIHRVALNQIEVKNIHKDYFFETSLLIELRRIGAKVIDVAIPARYNKNNYESSLSIPKVLFEFPPKLLKGLILRLKYQYFLYDFNMVSIYLLFGLPLTFFGLIFGIIEWVNSSLTKIPVTSGTALLATLSIFLGIQFIISAISLDINSVPKEALQKKNKYTKYN